jgi:hypothetical protein
MTYNKWYKVITNKVLNQSYIVTYGGQPLASDFPLNGSIFVNGNSNNQTTIGVRGSPSAYAYLEVNGCLYYMYVLTQLSLHVELGIAR